MVVGGLLHLVQQGGDWAGPQPAVSSTNLRFCNDHCLDVRLATIQWLIIMGVVLCMLSLIVMVANKSVLIRDQINLSGYAKYFCVPVCKSSPCQSYCNGPLTIRCEMAAVAQCTGLTCWELIYILSLLCLLVQTYHRHRHLLGATNRSSAVPYNNTNSCVLQKNNTICGSACLRLPHRRPLLSAEQRLAYR